MGGAFNIAMRIYSSLISLLLTLMGLAWICQGLHVGPSFLMRGFMVSDWRWALYGAILAALSLAHLYWTNTRKG